MAHTCILILALTIAAPAPVPSQSDWRRVIALPSGTRVTVIARDTSRLQGEVVSADDAALTLRTTAAASGSAATVETIARAKVVEIRTLRQVDRRGVLGAVGGAGGFFVGALLGGAAGSAIGRARGADPSNVGPMFWGTLGGGIVGAVFGATGHRVQEDVIYRAAAR